MRECSVELALEREHVGVEAVETTVCITSGNEEHDKPEGSDRVNERLQIAMRSASDAA